MKSSIVLFFAACVASCSDRCGSGASTSAGDGATPAASVSVTAAVVKEAGATKGCSLDGAPEVADKAVRADAGLTVVALSDGRIAIGYAGAKGDPRAVILGADGKTTALDVESASLPPPPPKPGERVIQRVTPLGFEDAGLKMRAALDVMDIHEDKSKSLRCGPADEALVSSEAEPRLRDCRTFSDGTRTFALESLVEGDTVRWILDDKSTGTPGDDAELHTAKFTAEKLAEPMRYLYQVPVAAFLPGTGVLVASREDGGLVLARREASLAPFGKPARYWFGAATTMPALALHEHDAIVLFSLQAQRDVWGTTFPIEAKDIPRPEKIALDDPSPPAEGDRTSITAAYFPKGDVLVGFADGKGPEKKARVTVLGKKLESLVPVSDLGAEVTEMRVTALGDGKAALAWIGKHDGMLALQTATLTCTY